MDLRIHKPNDPAVLAGEALVDDIDITSGDIALVRDAESIAQHLTIRFRHLFSEWFLDRATGVPYISRILTRPVDLVAIRAILLEVIVETPGVISVDRFTLSIDSENRKLFVDLTCTVEGDESQLQYTEELIING